MATDRINSNEHPLVLAAQRALHFIHACEKGDGTAELQRRGPRHWGFRNFPKFTCIKGTEPGSERRQSDYRLHTPNHWTSLPLPVYTQMNVYYVYAF